MTDLRNLKRLNGGLALRVYEVRQLGQWHAEFEDYADAVAYCLAGVSDPEFNILGNGRPVARVYDGQVIEVK
jgi:hypothetical protein